MYNSAFFYGRYKCIKKIGQGGMSSVFLCVDNNIHKKWAVKIIPCKKTEHFSVGSEIALLKSLDYYMFPRITDAFFKDDCIGIVTDYIEGETLDSYLKREGPLPINTALRYFEELLLSLDYLHSQNPGILYLDMKPDNIMIRPDGEIRLIDFGIAGSILLKGRSYGTIGYSPPEQYVTGQTLTEKTDIFALAMTLYSMLTGKRPLKDLSEQIELVKNSKTIPLFVRDLIIRCTNKNPEKRPNTSEILQALKNKTGTEKGALPIAIMMVVMTLLLSGAAICVYNSYVRKKHEQYKDEMLKKAEEYLDNGEYTRRGLTIISGYLNGDFLDIETEDYYTFEVAKNYFEIQKDYASAEHYFSRLNKEKYPQAEEYLLLCKKMRAFDSDDEKIARLMTGEVENGKERN